MSPASATAAIHGNGTALQTFGERFSLEQLHDEKRHAVDLADVVNGADVRVGYPGDRPRFTLKSLQLQARRTPRRREDLDRDGAIELRVASAIDLAHASGADWRQDFVTANSLSRSQGHGVSSRESRPFYAAADSGAPCQSPAVFLPHACDFQARAGYVTAPENSGG